MRLQTIISKKFLGMKCLNWGKKGSIGPDTKVYWDGAGAVPISFKDANAEYFYLINGVMYHVYSEDELHHAFAAGNIPTHTKIWGKNLPSKGINYSLLPVFDINFSPNIREFKGPIRLHENNFIRSQQLW